MSDPTLNLRLGLTVGSMDPRFRAACEEVLTAYDNLTAERDRLQAFIRESALNKGVPVSIVDAAIQEKCDEPRNR